MFDTSEGFESGVGWATPGVPVPRSAPELPAELRALRAAIDAVAKLDVTAMQGAAVLAQTAAVLAQAQRLQLLGLGLLAEVDRRGLHELAGAPTTARWVEAERVGVDRNAVAVARRLEVFPQVAAAVLAGQVSLPVAQRLQTALHRVRPHLDRPDGLIDGQPATEVLHGVVVDGVRTLVTEARGGFVADDPVLPALVGQLEQIVTGTYGSDLQVLEAGLLVLAGHVEAAQLPGCLALLVDALLPLQHEQRVRDGHDVCGLQLVREPDGRGWRLTGRLDLECGERLHVMLNAELLRDGAALHDTAAAAAQLRAGGQDPYDAQRPHAAGTARPRSSDERAHDALNNGLARYLAADLGGSHDKNPVQIVVIVAAERLDDAPGALPARTATGTRTPTSLTRRWTCGSALTRHLLALPGQVLAASHTQRTLTAVERRALHTQTAGHCQGAGCTRSTRHAGTIVHPHHANPWSTTGTTSLTDTVQLCDSCHHHVHHSTHPLRLKDGRSLGADGWRDPP